MTGRNLPLPFTMRSIVRGAGRTEVAVFACTLCPFSDELPLHRHSHAFNKEATVQGAERAGWQIKGARIICPLCVEKKAQRGKGEKPGPKFVPSAIVPPAPPAPIPEEVPMPPKAPEPTPAASKPVLHLPTAMAALAAAPSAAPIQPPALGNAGVAPLLNPGQKSAARHLLDMHFDDANGRYLNGWNDQKAAEELKVPRASLEQFRDLAYGPLKPLPELALAEDALRGLTNDAIAASELVQELRAQADKALKELAEAVKSTELRVAAARRALGLV